MSKTTESPGKASEAIPQVTANYARLSKELFGFGCKIKLTAEQLRKDFHLCQLMGSEIFPNLIVIVLNGYIYICLS